MAKRGIISKDKFRISAPGVDVDTAQPYELLMHEQFLFTQPYFFKYVPCPFAGNTSYGIQQSDVDVTVPDVTDDPLVLIWPESSENVVCWPKARSIGTGSSGSGYATENWTIQFEVISATVIRVRFIKALDSLRSPNGAYLVLMRRADA